jgi:hypothetical protein
MILCFQGFIPSPPSKRETGDTSLVVLHSIFAGFFCEPFSFNFKDFVRV